MHSLQNYKEYTTSDQTVKINPRVTEIPASSTVYLASKVSELIRDGEKVLSLAVGEPDFPPPKPITDAALKAMEDGHMRYTNVAGIHELRSAISEYLRSYKNVVYNTDQILCTNGAKQAVFQSLMCLICTRDEVIIPSPYWVSYPSIVKLVSH